MNAPPAAEQDRTTWQVNPRLDAPHLRPPAVIFALFDEDPLPAYRRRLLGRPPDGLPAGARPVWLAALWDRAFAEVTGDQVHLLVDFRDEHPADPGPAGEERVAVTRAFLSMSSSRPPGERFLVTRALLHRGRALAWRLGFDAVVGRPAAVVLTMDNALDLEAVGAP